MFKWGIENSIRAIDLACIEELTIPEIARELGASLSSVNKFYSANRAEIEAARKSIQLSDRVLYKILDLWGDGLSQADIAAAVNLSADVVRRIVLIAEYDERSENTAADDSLSALRSAHPEKMCVEDVRALTEYGNGHCVPRFLLSADVVLPLSEETARYKVPPAPGRRPITLATSPISF